MHKSVSLNQISANRENAESSRTVDSPCNGNLTPECTGAVLDCPEPACRSVPAGLFWTARSLQARQAQIEIEEWTAIGTCRGEIAEHIADDRKLPWFVAHRTDGRHCT